MTRILVTGAAGFVGSHLVERLVADGHEVVGYDNLSTGHRSFLATVEASPAFRLVPGDVLDAAALADAMQGAEVVFHLAANADVRFGTTRTRADLEQNVIGTWNVLEAMRASSARIVALASTGAIYGECPVVPTPEDAPFPVQTSLYAASKLAAEGYVQAYAEGFGLRALVFRFVSLLGERYHHGHVIDFVRQLRAHPDWIEVLGDGRQRKSYLDVRDAVGAMVLALARARGPVEILNVGSDEVATVDDSLGWICDHLGLAPRRIYRGGERGWPGDNPLIHLDCTRLCALGWAPSGTIRDGVIRTVEFLERHPWLLEHR